MLASEEGSGAPYELSRCQCPAGCQAYLTPATWQKLLLVKTHLSAKELLIQSLDEGGERTAGAEWSVEKGSGAVL